MAAVPETSAAQLSVKLAQAPTDPDLVRSFAASCIEVGELARLRGGLEPHLGVLSGPLAVRPVAEALATTLLERARRLGGSREEGAVEASRLEAVELYLRAARLLSAMANDRIGAARALAEAWDVLPDERIALHAQSLFSGTTEPPEYTLVALAEVGGPEQRMAALRRLAASELERRRLDRAHALFSQLLALAPGDTDAAEGLSVIAGLRKAASAEVDRLTRALDEASPANRKGLLRELGEALHACGRTKEAERSFEDGARLGDEASLRALERILRDGERLEDLARVWQDLIPGLPRERQVAQKKKLVLLLRDELGQPERARGLLEVVEARELGADQASPERLAHAFEEAAAVAVTTDEKLALLKRGLDALVGAEGAGETQALPAAEAVAGKATATARAAERLWRKVRALDPRDKDALAFFRAHYRRQPDVRKAYANLAQLHATTEDPGERRALAIEMAELSQSAVETALAEGGTVARSAIERAIESWRLIESDLLAEREGSQGGADPAAPPEPALVHAWSELRTLYASTGRWHAYVDLLDRWIQCQPDTQGKIELLFDIVAVYQDPARLPMPAMVLQTYQRIVALAPHQPVALEQLAAGLAEREQWMDLLEVLGKKVELATDPVELIALFHQIADLYLDRVRSDSQALIVLERLLEVAPTDLEVVGKLRELYQRRADFERVFATLQRELELGGDAGGRDQTEILRDLARVAEEELLQPERAIALQRQLLERDPTDAAALEALQRLHAEREDWPSYVQVLEQRVAETKAKTQKLPLLLELGETVLTRLGDVARAEQIFATIAESTPTSSTARRFLQKIYVSRQRWDELARLFARQQRPATSPPNARWKDYVTFLKDAARHEPHPPLASAIHVELARVLELELEDKKGAAEHLELALKAVDDQVELARRHRALIGEETSSTRRLGPLTTLARHSPDPAERFQSWLAIGHIHRRAKDPVHACEAWGRALVTGAQALGAGLPAGLDGSSGAQLDDPEGAIEEVASLLEEDAGATGRWEQAKNALDEALSHLPAEGSRLRVAIHRMLGSIARARLLEPDLAIRHLKWVLQLAPGDPEALEELEKLYYSRNDFAGLEEVYRARVDAAATTPERIEALSGLARLYDDVTLDPEQAAEAWQAILRLAPEHGEAQSALLSALERAGLESELAVALEGALVRTSDPEDRDRLQLRLMDLWANRLGDPEAAVDHAGDLVERLDPEHQKEQLASVIALLERYRADKLEIPGVGAALEVAYRRTGRLGELYHLLERRAEVAGSDEATLIALLDELAMLAEAELRSPERAFSAIKRRAALTPADPEVWAEVERLAEPLSAWEEVAALFVSAIADTRVPPERRATLRLRLADIYHRRLIELEEAIVETERALSESKDPDEQLLALESLEILFKKTADLESFVRVKVEAARRVLSRTRKRQKLIEAAAALSGALGRPAEAVALLEPLWIEAPGDAEVVDTLLQLCERQGDQLRADELLGDAIEAALSPTRKDALRLKRAIHRRDKLDLWEVAISELIDLVGSVHVGREARRTLLEICRARESEAQRDVILEVLVDYYRAAEDGEGLINALVVQAEFAPPGAERARALIAAAVACVPPLRVLVGAGPSGSLDAKAVAAMRERPEECQQAFDLLIQALFEHPAGMGEDLILLHLDRLAQAAGLEHQLAESLSTVSTALVGAPEEASQLPAATVEYARHMLREAAAIFEERLGLDDRATECWQRELLLADSANATSEPELESIRPALVALERLHRRAENIDSRREALGRLASLLSDPLERAEAFERLAMLELELGNSQDASIALEQALSDLGAADRVATRDVRQRLIATLEGVLARDERFEELVELLIESSASELDMAVQREFLLRAGELAAERLGDNARAASIYQRLVSLDPTDEFALTQLVELESQLERWDGVIAALRLLRTLAEQAGAEHEVASIDHRIGLIELDHMRSAERALVSFAAALSNDPRHAASLEGLARIEKTALTHAPIARRLTAEAHRKSGSPAELAAVLERIATFDAPSSELHLELAELWLGPLSSPSRAWNQLHRGYALDAMGPAGSRCREHLLSLGAAAATLPEPERGESRRRLVSILGDVAEGLTPPHRRARKEADLHAISQLGLDEPTLVPAWRALAREVPPAAEVVELLERHARAANDPALLADALSARLVGKDGATRNAIELDLARTLARIPDRRGEAAEVLFLLRSRAPEHQEATDLLVELLGALGRYAERAEVLEEALALATDLPGGVPPVPGTEGARHQRRDQLRLELATSRWRHLGQPAASVRLAGEVLAEGGEGSAQAIALLEALWAEGAERKAIHRELEPAYTRAERWDKLIALYTSSLETDDAELQFECLTKLAALQSERLASPDASFQTMLALLERTDDEAPRMSELLDELERLARPLERWRELAARLEAMIGLGRGGPALMLRLAKLYETHGDDARAAHYFGFAFERTTPDPSSIEARDGLSRVLEKSSRWRDLVVHLERAAELLPAEDTTRLPLLERAALIHADRLGSHEEALALHQRIVSEAPPESPLALASHERIAAIYEQLGDFEGLHYHLKSWLADVTDEQLADTVRTRLGISLVRFPELAADGLVELEEVLRRTPTNAEARAAVLSVLTTANAEEASRTLEPELAIVAAHGARLLESLFGETASSAELADYLEAQLRVLADGEERQATLERLARLMLELGHDERAFGYLAEALRGDPGRVDLEGSLEALASTRRYWEPLATVYEELANREAEDVSGRYDLKLAEVLRAELDRPAEAAIWYERHLEHSPHSLEAIEPLLAHYVEAGDAQSEARILELHIDYSAGPAELPDLRKRLGILRMDQLGDVQGAIDALEGCLPDGAADPEIVKRLERLYARGEHFGALIGLYRNVLELAVSDKERLETLAKMTQVFEVRQGDLQSARETGRRMLAIDPTHRFALTSLERLERALGDWEAVDELLGQKLLLAPNDAAKVRVLIDRAEVAFGKRESPDQAIEYLLAADRLVGPGPGPDELVRGLAALLKTEPKLRVHAARALARRYRARAAWQEAVNTTMIELMVTDDPDQCVALARQASELASERLEDKPMALRLLVTALRKTPQSAELRALVTRVAAEVGDYGPMLKLGDELLKKGLQPEVLDGFARWLGAIQVALGLSEKATSTYEQLLQVAPADTEAGDTLAALYHARGDWSSLRGLYRHRKDVTPATEHALLDLDLALYLATQKTGDDQSGEATRAARTAIDELLSREPDERLIARLEARVEEPVAGAIATQVLASRLAARGDELGLIALSSRRAGVTPDPEEASRLLTEAARVAERNDPAGAVDLLGRAALAAPEVRATWAVLNQLARKVGASSQLAELLTRGLEATSPETGRDLALWLAELEAEHLSLPDGLDRAVATLRHASDRLPADIELRRKLIAYEVTRGDVAAVEEEITALTELLDDSERERKYWRVLRRLAEAKGDDVRLVVADEAILAREPGDTEAAEHLAGFYRKRGRWEDLAELLILRVEAARTPELAAGFWAEIASLRMGPLADSDGAFAAWEMAQELDPTHAEATRKLAQLHAERGEWAEVGALWVEHAEALTGTDDPRGRQSEIAQAWLEAARVFEDRTRTLDEAIIAYENAVAVDERLLPAINALIGHYGRARRYPELADLLEKKANALTQEGEQVVALVQAAAVHLDQLRDHDAAQRLVARALQLEADHLEARLLSARIHVRDGRPDEAIATLEELAHRTEGKRKVRLLMEVARLRLELPNEAAERYAKSARAIAEALALDPDAAQLDTLAIQVFERAERWDELIAMLERAYSVARTDGERCERALMLARIFSGPRRDLDRLDAWVAKARAADPDNESAMGLEVDALLARDQLEQAERLLAQVVERLEVKRAAEELVTRSHQLGLLRMRLGRVVDAIAAFSRAHDVNGKHVPNLLDYGRALVQAKRWTEALAIHQALLLQRQAIPDEGERLAVLERIALASWEANQKDRARAYLARLLSEDPQHAGGLALKARFSA